uniref:Uncharacterized protein n=1 Tax=Setaria italica TaxID=4555 RepID=K4AHN9_SETIT
MVESKKRKENIPLCFFTPISLCNLLGNVRHVPGCSKICGSFAFLESDPEDSCHTRRGVQSGAPMGQLN